MERRPPGEAGSHGVGRAPGRERSRQKCADGCRARAARALRSLRPHPRRIKHATASSRTLRAHVRGGEMRWVFDRTCRDHPVSPDRTARELRSEQSARVSTVRLTRARGASAPAGAALAPPPRPPAGLKLAFMLRLGNRLLFSCTGIWSGRDMPPPRAPRESAAPAAWLRVRRGRNSRNKVCAPARRNYVSRAVAFRRW